MVRVLKSNHHITILSVCHKANSSAANNCRESKTWSSAAGNYTESKQRRGQNGFVPPQIMETAIVVFRRSSQGSSSYLLRRIQAVKFNVKIVSVTSISEPCPPWFNKVLQAIYFQTVPLRPGPSQCWKQHNMIFPPRQPLFPPCSPHSWQQMFCKQQVSTLFCLDLAPMQFCKFSPFLEILSPISLTANLCKFHFVFRMLGSKH